MAVKLTSCPVAAVRAVTDFAGFEDLLDGAEQALGIFEHDAVEIAALRFVERAALQCFEIETNRRDRRFQLVGDRVEEAVLTFVALDFADDEDGVYDETRDDHAEENDAENEQPGAAFVEDDPTDVEEYGERDQATA